MVQKYNIVKAKTLFCTTFSRAAAFIIIVSEDGGE
jgi:hypothetical protein